MQKNLNFSKSNYLIKKNFFYYHIFNKFPSAILLNKLIHLYLYSFKINHYTSFKLNFKDRNFMSLNKIF